MTEPTNSPSLDPAIVKALEGLPQDLRDFGWAYQSDIRPGLQNREQERIKAAERARTLTGVGIAIGILGALASMFAFRFPIGVAIAAVAGVAVHGIGRAPLRRLAAEAKEMIVGPVAQQFDMQYAMAPGDQPLVHQMRELKLVPNWDRATFEDKLTGARKGRSFEFFEAKLEERRTTTDGRGRTRTRWVTVFRGQCMAVHFEKRFHGRTLVVRDAGLLNAFGGASGLKRARLEDPVFEKAFEVYTSDQVEARYLLTPDFMEKLLELEKAFHGGKLRCAFDQGELFVTVQGGDLFEPGSMFTPLDNPDRVRELLDDFAAVMNLIDEVAGPRDQ